MSVRELIKAAQKEKAAEMNSFEVPEWTVDEKEPFTIFNTPFTIADVAWIERKGEGIKAIEFVYTVIRKAMDSEGKKHFTIADYKFLSTTVRSKVIARIVRDLNKGEAIDTPGE